MLSTIAAGTVRHRRLILGVGGGLAVGCPWIGLRMSPTSFGVFVLTLLPLALALASWAVAGVFSQRSRPAMFAVDPSAPAFRTLPDARQVYFVIGLVFLVAPQAATALDDAPRASALDVVMIGVFVIGAAGWVVAAWRGTLDVQLRPDGLVDRYPFGTLIVPWEAMAPGYPLLRSPSARSLVLTYARPELVRRRGLTSRRRISADTVDPRFLGSAIAYYVAYPQCRAAIGTQGEHDRLLYALTGQPPSETVS